MSTGLTVDREQHLLALLQDNGNVSTSQVASELGVSEMTIRRDLTRLEHKGMVRRVHGGAVLASDNDPGYWLRHKRYRVEKEAIGRAAAAMVESGQTIFLDTGTTAMEVARNLIRRSLQGPFTARVVTHAVNIAAEMVAHANLNVYQIGGPTDATIFGATGLAAVKQIEELNFDIFFMGVSGVDLEAGLTNSNPVGVETKRAALGRAREVFAIADSSKWGHVSFTTIAPLSAVGHLITDASIPRNATEIAARAGVEVIVAD
ncbi:MAG: DeoR/GlpR family DNA-binding transcription regulator [Trueperaceae bacterium]|nr:DeoR/GlpR family DNA-binding transcription regulator [Trueperaceae bacterium]HRQ10523.1 DeoR/GlpR family DNA-binding transcription regulator [Trueperaceae bacterium]